MHPSIESRGRAATILLALSLALGGGCTDSTGPPAPLPAGSIRVVIVTTGINPDSDGYVLTVDDSITQSAKANDTLILTKLAPATHLLKIDGIAGNCATDGSSQRTVPDISTLGSEVKFAVSCVGPLMASGYAGMELLFVRQGRIFRTTVGSANVVALSVGEEPTWSPDGNRIAFVRGGDVYVIDADGANERPIATGAPNDSDAKYNAGRLAPAWSPDGQRLAMYSAKLGIIIAPVDGAVAPASLNNGQWDDWGLSGSPAWSPNGKQIAFASDYASWDPGIDVYIGNVGDSSLTNITKLTKSAVSGSIYAQPAWSPDGSRIAIVTCSRGSRAYVCIDSNVSVMNADGSNLRVLAHAHGFARPSWAPDGQSIIFANDCWDHNCPSAVFYVSADGTRTGMLIDDAHSPSWRR